MTLEAGKQLIAEIHKTKDFIPTEWERKFLEDLSFQFSIEARVPTEAQGRVLQEVYRKSQGG